jgi:NAD(P)-dependent dehydrogenase (short-subunit alcohol dehydrogenase family)
MSSVAGLCGVAGMSIYSASKAAVDGAVRSLAVELAPRDIRINSIAAAGLKSVLYEEHVKSFTKEELTINDRKHLMGFGTPEDVALAAGFLLSDASKWITGTTMIVDGGYSCT